MEMLLLILIFLTYGLYTGKKLIYGIHMLQQNSYMNHRYFRWLKVNKKQLISWKSVLLLLPVFGVWAEQQFGIDYLSLGSVALVYGVC